MKGFWEPAQPGRKGHGYGCEYRSLGSWVQPPHLFFDMFNILACDCLPGAETDLGECVEDGIGRMIMENTLGLIPSWSFHSQATVV